MNIFIEKKSVLKKSVVMGVILVLISVGIYIYAAWHSRILQMPFAIRISYLKAYAMSWRDRGVNDEANASVDASSVPVLLYHGVWAQQNAEDGTNVDFEHFSEQIKALKSAGYRTLSLQDFQDFMAEKKKVPERSILITFDDGRKDSYYPADPVLEAAGFRATMAVIVGRTKDQSNFHLTYDELKMMRDSGRWDFMSHGESDHDLIQISATGAKGHFMSNQMWLEEKGRLETDEEFNARVNQDLADSKKKLSEILGLQIDSYAVPFSDYGQDGLSYPQAKFHVLQDIVSNYTLGFYEMWPGGDFLANYPGSGPFIKRISVEPHWSGNDLVNLLESIRDKKPQFPEGTQPGIISGWSRSWGILKVENGAVHLMATPVTTGAAAFLDGTRNWRDYKVAATVDWLKGNSLQITSRMKDNDNYVACVYASDHVQVQQSLNGSQRVIKGTIINLGATPKTGIKIGMSVQGRTVQCEMDGKAIVSTSFLDPLLSQGGFGFKVWDPQPGNSDVAVKEISVSEIMATPKP